MSTDDDFDVTRVAGTHEGDASLRTRAAKGVFWVATGAWGRQVAVFVVFAVLARLLEVADFGLVAYALVFVGFTNIVAEEGIVDALVQRKELELAHLDAAFWTALGFALALTALLAALSVPIAMLLGENELAPILVALALAIPIASSSLVPRALLTRELQFKALTVRSLAAIAVGSICGITAALLGAGVWSLVVQNLVGVTTGTLVLWRVTGFRPRLTFSFAHCRELLGFGTNVVGFRLLVYLNRHVDELLIGIFLGPVALGFYSVGYRMLRMLVQMTSSLIDRVSFPLLSRLQDKPARLKNAIYKSTSFATLIAFPVFLTAAVLAPQVVAVFFGPKWDDSVPVMQILALYGIVQVLTYLNGTTIKSLGKPGWLVVIVGVTSALKVSALLVAVQYGFVEVAVAAMLVGWAVAPLYYEGVRRLAGIELGEYWRSLRVPLAAAVVAAGTMVGIRLLLADARAGVVLAAAGVAGAIVYYVAVRVLSPPLAAEVRDLVGRGLPSRRGGGRTAKVLTEGDS